MAPDNYGRAVGLPQICVAFSVACAPSVPSASVPSWCEDAPAGSVTITPSWRDRSPHRQGFVEVRGASLHYLEWATPPGTDAHDLPALVLLAGAGQGAHIFDELAPCLADRFHVIALTRRGTAPSSAPDNGYAIDSLADDDLAMLDSLGIARASFAGHSLAGAEITRIAARHPERVQSLVYLDASWDRGNVADVAARNPVPRPPPPTGNLSLDAYRAWLQRDMYGGWSDAQEADLRAVTDAASGTRRRSPHGLTEALQDDAAHPQPFDSVRAPALVIVALQSARSLYPWLDPTRDGDALRRATRYVDSVLRPYAMRGPARQRNAMPQAVFIELAGRHDIFISRRDTVLKAMRAFLPGGASATSGRK